MLSGSDTIDGICPSGRNAAMFRTLKHEYGYTGGRKSAVYSNSGNRIMLGDTTGILLGLLPVYANKLEFIRLDTYNLINENTAGLHEQLLTNLRLSAELLIDTGFLLLVTNKPLYRITRKVTEQVFENTNLIADFTNRMCNSDAGELQHYLLFKKGCMDVQTTSLLNRSFSGKRFSNMLPDDLVRYCVHTACSKDAILLNTIKGCDTMAAPILYLNRQDNGNRKFLLLCPENTRADYTNLQLMLAAETDFDCYIFGNELFINDSSGQLNTGLPAKQIREYIWYTETGVGFFDNSFSLAEPYLLGIRKNTAIYLMYEYDARTVLNQEFLSTMQTKAGKYIVYAHECTLSSVQLQRKKIQFKQIR